MYCHAFATDIANAHVPVIANAPVSLCAHTLTAISHLHTLACKYQQKAKSYNHAPSHTTIAAGPFNIGHVGGESMTAGHCSVRPLPIFMILPLWPVVIICIANRVDGHNSDDYDEVAGVRAA